MTSRSILGELAWCEASASSFKLRLTSNSTVEVDRIKKRYSLSLRIIKLSSKQERKIMIRTSMLVVLTVAAMGGAHANHLLDIKECKESFPLLATNHVITT